MDELTKLAIKYGTDKWGKHHYTPVYNEMFMENRERVEKVLEIGVGEGASLRMWRDYFPNAMIYGAEIDESRIIEEDRIKVLKCDQGKNADLVSVLVEIGQDLDVIIDDGSHDPMTQGFTCLMIMKRLLGNPTYVIEDVADKETVLDMIEDFYDVEVVECGKRYDDRLIIVRHKDE